MQVRQCSLSHHQETYRHIAKDLTKRENNIYYLLICLIMLSIALFFLLSNSMQNCNSQIKNYFEKKNDHANFSLSLQKQKVRTKILERVDFKIHIKRNLNRLIIFSINRDWSWNECFGSVRIITETNVSFLLSRVKLRDKHYESSFIQHN